MSIITHPQSKEYGEGWDRIFGRKTLEQVLQELGNTSEEVVAKLRAEGIKGKMSAPGSCPIACYLKRKGFYKPSVTQYDVSVVTDEPDPDLLPRTYHYVKNTEAIKMFVIEFDHGRYPELEI